ncbi:MAG: three-Cys-motif partner protein TcmP [Candidatus Aquicultor sp.]
MANKTIDFYNDQSDKTAVKIQFYGNYIEEYLVKILMTYGSCIIADLFCGQGKNGTAKGSPLTLLDKISYILTIPHLKAKKPKLTILFNDKDAECIKTLRQEIQENSPTGNIKIYADASDYKDIIGKILTDPKFHDKTPKFFFLDPYTYSLVNTSELQALLSLKNAEILIFLPTFHAYRFASKQPPKPLEDFIVDFTNKKIADYKDFLEFIESVHEGLKTKLGTQLVRPIVIDSGTTKNCLFLITKNLVGMDTINNIVWKKTGEKWGININKQKQEDENQLILFDKKEVTGIAEIELQKLLYEEIQKNKKLSNVEIIRIVVEKMYRLTDARKALSTLKKDQKIQVGALDDTTRKGPLYITIDNRNNTKTEFTIKE